MPPSDRVRFRDRFGHRDDLIEVDCSDTVILIFAVVIVAKNPVYADILKTLEKEDITREERVKLVSDIESLHSFNTMLN